MCVNSKWMIASENNEMISDYLPTLPSICVFVLTCFAFRQIRFRDVKPGEFVNYQDKFIPRRHGERRIVVTFSSRQMDEIFGCCMVNVRG